MMGRTSVNEYEEGIPVIIGGMVLDIHSTPSIPPLPRTTTPGKVVYTLGGVARNVADCVSKLGTRPYMISAVGHDMPGNLLLEHWKSNGLPVEGIRRGKDIETAVVCNMFDSEGELAAAVASVEAIEKFLTPEWIQQFKSNVRCAPVLMFDANLSPIALEATCRVAAQYNIPVWFEPVSVTKSKRVASVAKYITFASPNEDELIAMANAVCGGSVFHPVKIDNNEIKYSPESLFRMLEPAVSVVLDSGIRVLVVTLGSYGVLLCSQGISGYRKVGGFRRNKSSDFGKHLYDIVNSLCTPDRLFNTSIDDKSNNLFVVHYPAISASVVRLTGAGDCLVGGTLASICAGLDIMQSVAVGIAAAKAAVEAESNVPAEFNLASIADDARSVYFGAKVFCKSML